MVSTRPSEKTKPSVLKDAELFTKNQQSARRIPQTDADLKKKMVVWGRLASDVGPVYPVRGVVNGRCTCGDPNCSKPGKHPWTPHGYKDATTDLAQIEAWVQEKPNSNVGIATGAELCAMDVDGPTGEEALLRFQEEFGRLPETWEVLTGREGGRHLYFSKPPEIVLKSRSIAPGLDIKAEGGGVVAPGSKHISGRLYRVKDHKRDIQDLPEPWVEFLATPTKKEIKVESKSLHKKIIESQRNNTIFGVALTIWKALGDKEVVQATVHNFNRIRCEPPLPDAEVNKTVSSACRGNSISVTQTNVSKLIIDTELMQMVLPPIRWIVADAIAAGLCLLVGKAKVGKSLWALNLAYAIATSEQFLGNFSTELGDVIYLPLEDGLSRIQRRFLRVSKGKPSGRIYFQTAWPRFDEKGFGLNFLERELDRLPDCKLVVIDTFQKIRAPKKSARSDYEEDYRALEIIQQVALQRNIVIMLLHHLKKEKTEDPLDGVLGSTALSGVADSIIILDRPRHSIRGSLTVIGRDLENGDITGALELSPDRSGNWKWIGPAGQVRKNENDNKVLAMLSAQGKSLTQMVKETELPQTTCLEALHRMLEDGIAIKGQDKLYRLAPEPPHASEEEVYPC